MIILDTNIISEMMKSVPDEGVAAWLDQQNILSLYITSISMGEIYYGLSVLPSGKRRNTLEKSFGKVVDAAFDQRILSFTDDVSSRYGVIMAKRRKLGRPMSVPDGQIAAIAGVSDAILATRNIKDFIQCDIELINPFDS